MNNSERKQLPVALLFHLFIIRIYMEQTTPFVWNPILRQYLVNAPKRMNRREGTTECPFCADITSGKVAPDRRVWLHPNDFPPLLPPTGEAYVVIYSRDHNRKFTQLSVDEVSEVARLWRDLYRDLASRYAAVMIFETSSVARGQIAIQVAPEPCHLTHLIHAQLRKFAIMIPAINDHIGLAGWREQWGKIIRMQPDAPIWRHFSTGNIRAKRALSCPFTPIHTFRRIHQILA